MAQMITLSDVASESDSYELVDDATRQKVLTAVKSFPMIQDELTDGGKWMIHRGNLTLNRSVYVDFPLIVEGDLVIDGYYDDYAGSDIGAIIVLGDLTAKHVFTWGPMAVTGSVIAKDGLVLAHYNDFTFEVGGVIEARALLIDDKSSDYSVTNVRASVHVGNDGPDVNTGEILRHFAPATLVQSYAGEFEDEYDEEWFAENYPSHDACRGLLDDGQSIFRATVAPKVLLESVKHALALDTPRDNLAGLVQSDPLVSAIVASRDDLTDSLQDQLIEAAEPLTLRQLAENPIMTTNRLERIAAVSQELLKIVVDHPNAPDSAIAMAVTSTDPETRQAALNSQSLSIENYRRLVFDDVASVRQRALYHHAIYQLEPAEIDRLVSDPEKEIRQTVASVDGLLNELQLERLSGDSEKDVRFAVAEMLVNQSNWASPPTISPEARVRIAEQMMSDSAPQVAMIATLASTDDVQLAAARDWLDKARESEVDRWKCEHMAKRSASKPVLDLLAASDIADVINALCENPALTERSQHQLLESRELSDEAILELGQNPNLSQESLTKVISRGRLPGKQFLIYSAVQHRDDLSAEHLEMLGQFRDPLCVESWALTAMHSRFSTRGLIQQGIRSWYDDEPEILGEVESFAGLNDEAWWTALASASHEGLREIAARNIHTPITSLQKMASENADNESLIGAILTNPNMPIDHPLFQQHPIDKVANPSIKTTELESILKQNLRNGDADDTRSRILDVISARKLRD